MSWLLFPKQNQMPIWGFARKECPGCFFTSPQQKGATELMMVCSTFYHEIHLSCCFFSTMSLESFWDEKFLRVDLWSSWPKDVGGLRIQDGRWIASEQNFVIKSISDTKSNGFLIHPNDIYISVYKIYSNYSISWTTDVFFVFCSSIIAKSPLNDHLGTNIKLS